MKRLLWNLSVFLAVTHSPPFDRRIYDIFAFRPGLKDDSFAMALETGLKFIVLLQSGMKSRHPQQGVQNIEPVDLQHAHWYGAIFRVALLGVIERSLSSSDHGSKGFIGRSEIAITKVAVEAVGKEIAIGVEKFRTGEKNETPHGEKSGPTHLGGSLGAYAENGFDELVFTRMSRCLELVEQARKARLSNKLDVPRSHAR